MQYDLLIIGGGPAATAGGVYAARKHLKTLIVTKEFGGQSTVSPLIHNWIGTPEIKGEDLTKALKKHIEEYIGEYLALVEGERIVSLSGTDGNFIATTEKGVSYEAKSVLLAVGASRRKLTAQGADTFDQKGLTYCATCDGPLFSGMDVAVIGGGNAGFESAQQLLAYVKSVTLLDTNESFKADAVTVENVLKHENMKAILNAETIEILGDTFVNGLTYKDRKTGELHSLPVQGIFVEIGVVPSTSMVEGFLELDPYKHIVVDPRTQKTSVLGVWAAGDCTDGLYCQNNIAAGDAIKALEDIYIHLKNH